MATVALATARAENWCQWMADSSTIFGYANVRGVREIPLIAQLVNGQDTVSRFTSQIREWTAIDLDSVTDVWFGVTGKDDALFVLQGNYNLATIRGVLGGIEQFRVETPPNAEFTVRMPDDKKPGKVNVAAFLNPRIIAFGPPHQVEKFLDNVAQKRVHPKAPDFAMLEKPSHLVEVVLLKFPNDDGKAPPFITENTRRIHLGVDAGETIDFQLTFQPANQAMVEPLSRAASGLTDLLHLIPPGQIPVPGPVRPVLDSVQVSATKEAVVLLASLPLELIRQPLAAKLNPAAAPGVAAPAANPPAAKPPAPAAAQ
jgi:hypothetical protein